MVFRTPNELRAEARRLRELATEGDDARLKAAVLELADEFDREAESAATDHKPADDPDDNSE